MTTYTTEQKTLLPLATSSTRPTPHQVTFDTTRHSDVVESCALALVLFLSASQCLILYGIHNLPYAPASRAFCDFLTDLAVGLRLSIPASLPTATLLFLASPYIARPERLVGTWYLVMLCYFVGSTTGALLLLWVR